jgi:hypothetical protein
VNPIIFQLAGNLTDGRYVPGEYSWPCAVILNNAAVGCDDYPTAGTLTITLEVGGVLTQQAFTINPSGPLNPVLTLNVDIPANTVVRWKASFDGTPAESADGVAIMVYPTLASLQPDPPLTIQWIDGASSLTLFNYVNGQFVETSPGISWGLLTISQTTDQILFSVAGTAALLIQNGVCHANDFYAEGMQSTDNPRVQFQIGGVPIANLSATALYVVNVNEAPTALGPQGSEFDFFNNGVLVAVLSGSGLVAAQIEEGIP